MSTFATKARCTLARLSPAAMFDRAVMRLPEAPATASTLDIMDGATSWTPLDAPVALIARTVDAWASDPDRTTRRETYRA